jgi:hypothetical protein
MGQHAYGAFDFLLFREKTCFARVSWLKPVASMSGAEAVRHGFSHRGSGHVRYVSAAVPFAKCVIFAARLPAITVKHDAYRPRPWQPLSHLGHNKLQPSLDPKAVVSIVRALSGYACESRILVHHCATACQEQVQASTHSTHNTCPP